MVFAADRFCLVLILVLWLEYLSLTKLMCQYSTEKWDYLRGDEAMWAAVVLL